MIPIQKTKIDLTNEYLILSYMIMDKEVLYSTFNKYKSGQLKTKHFSVYLRPIFRWLISYYAKHHKPPKKTIQKVFDRNQNRLSKEAKEIVEECLERLAIEFSQLQPNTDPNYVSKEILPDFIREREISSRIDSAQNKIDQGNFLDAENILSTYSPVVEEEEDENLGTIIPYTKEDIMLNSQEDFAAKNAFRFSGDLHKMIGGLGSSWLVAVTGVEKSSKSFLMQEIGFIATLYQKKKVLMINIELSGNLVRNRVRKRLSLTANKEDTGHIISPILDCENNQFGICQLRKKINKKNLFENNIDIVRYSDRPNWKICDKCRFNNIQKNAINKTKRFIPAIWFKDTKVRKITNRRILEAIKNNQLSRLSNLRIKCFPRFSVSFDEVYDYIRRYIDKTKWNPDIIIIDYIDILSAEKGNLDTRIDVDTKWKKAAQLAGELDCLVINADQATKSSRTQYALDQMSTSESKTKDGHLDVRIAINQTDAEKEIGLARINILFHRHAKFNLLHEVLITQRLETAEPAMDNARIFERGKKYNVAAR